MPLYPYQCKECGKQFEKLMSMAQRREDIECTDCPVCGSNIVEPAIGKTSFLLKGGGWYKDGYQKG